MRDLVMWADGKEEKTMEVPCKLGKNQRKIIEHLVKRIQEAKKAGNYPGDPRGIQVTMLQILEIFPGHYEVEIRPSIDRMVENDMLWERSVGWRLSNMWYDLLIT